MVDGGLAYPTRLPHRHRHLQGAGHRLAGQYAGVGAIQGSAIMAHGARRRGRIPQAIEWTEQLAERLRPGAVRLALCACGRFFETRATRLMSTEARIASCISLFLLLLAGAPALASPASALGPQLPVVEPRDGFVGRLQVSPPNGPAGTPVTISAERLPPNEEFALAWRTVVGAWNVAEGEYHGREFKVVAYEIGKFNSNAAGALVASFTAPEDFGFVHDIVLQQRDRLLTQAAFSLDMTVEISPESGPPGTLITVEVQGIGWRPLFNSRHLLYDNRFTGWISSVTTHGSAKFVIPATGNPGP